MLSKHSLELLWHSLDVQQANGELPGSLRASLCVFFSFLLGRLNTHHSWLGPSWYDPLLPLTPPCPTATSLLCAAVLTTALLCSRWWLGSQGHGPSNRQGQSDCSDRLGGRHKKLKSLLDDTSVYEVLKKDPPRPIKLGWSSFWGSGIDKEPSHKIFTPRFSPCQKKFYGLPKIHKKGAPLMPIVSGIGSITHKAAKYLAKVLNPLINKNGYPIKNSEDFVKKIEDLEVPPPRPTGNLSHMMCWPFLLAYQSMRPFSLSEGSWSRTPPFCHILNSL